MPRRAVRALPPYTSPMVVKVQGFETNTSFGTMFYVQKFLCCSYTPPIQNIEHDRDNDGRTTKGFDGQKTEAPKEMERPRIAPSYEARTDLELSQEHPSHASLTDPIDITTTADPLFPGIDAIVTEKLPQLVIEHQNVADKEVATLARWADLVSTLPSSSQASNDIVKGDLTIHEVVNDPADNSPDAFEEPLQDFFKDLKSSNIEKSKHFYPLGVHHISVKALFPWRKIIPLKPEHEWAFALPIEAGEYTWAWLYRNPNKTLRKRGICLELSFFNAENYLIGKGILADLEGRIPKSQGNNEQQAKRIKSSVLLACLHMQSEQGDVINSSINSKQLRSMLLFLAQGNRKKLNSYAHNNGIRIKSKQHPADFQSLIEDLFQLF